MQQHQGTLRAQAQIPLTGLGAVINHHALLARVPEQPLGCDQQGFGPQLDQPGQAFELHHFAVIDHRAAGCLEAIGGLALGIDRAAEITGLGHPAAEVITGFRTAQLPEGQPIGALLAQV